MSWVIEESRSGVRRVAEGNLTGEPHTNDRRYESKDSREMEKCSMSPKLLRVSIDVRDVVKYRFGHDGSLSVGDGCSRSIRAFSGSHLRGLNYR